MVPDPHITISDIRVIFCVKGAKKAFDAAGLDFADFVKNGCKASQLMGHGYDSVVERIIESKTDKGEIDGQ